MMNMAFTGLTLTKDIIFEKYALKQSCLSTFLIDVHSIVDVIM